MSEYMERHTVSRLIGAPPGYVGFDQGGLLTDGVDQHPHCVLLLDEIEKAHPDLFNILLQVMDNGTLTDSNGKKVDFRNVILIMTTNAGASDAAKESIGFGRGKREDENEEAIKRLFTPEFRNRLDATIPFAGLSQEIIEMVVDKFILQLEAQLADRNVTIALTTKARKWLAVRGYDEAFGARPLGRLIQEHVKKPMADELLFGSLQKGGGVKIDVDKNDPDKLSFKYVADPKPTRKEKPEPEAVDVGSFTELTKGGSQEPPFLFEPGPCSWLKYIAKANNDGAPPTEGILGQAEGATRESRLHACEGTERIPLTDRALPTVSRHKAENDSEVGRAALGAETWGKTVVRRFGGNSTRRIFWFADLQSLPRKIWGKQWRQIGGGSCGRIIPPMKHERRIPAWLLRDLPALAGLFACFWLFVIPLITEGYRIIMGGKPDQKKFDALAHHGSSTPKPRSLMHCGAKPTAASATIRNWWIRQRPRRNHIPADNMRRLMTRCHRQAYRSYMDQVQPGTSQPRRPAHYTDILRRTRRAQSPCAPPMLRRKSPRMRAAQHERATADATAPSRASQEALMLSSARSARPSKHERGLHQTPAARLYFLASSTLNPPLPRAPRFGQRSPPHAYGAGVARHRIRPPRSAAVGQTIGKGGGLPRRSARPASAVLPATNCAPSH